MQLARPLPAADPRQFGRGRAFVFPVLNRQLPTVGADLKLFATTFLAGFVFVSVLIA